MCKNILSLLLIPLIATQVFAKSHKKKHKQVTQSMTVAAIRPEQNNETFVRVIFLQSQRFYKLSNDADPKFLKLLNGSLQSHTPVIVKRETEESDVILSVTKPK